MAVYLGRAGHSFDGVGHWLADRSRTSREPSIVTASGVSEPGLLVRNLSKSFKGTHGHEVFSDLSFELGKGGRLAVLGRNGQGKSTLIKILGGVLGASSGQVNWHVRPSWPIGFGGGFQGSLSGMDNIRFLSR